MLLLRRPVPVRQGAELVLGVIYRILQRLPRSGWRPLDVQFAYPAPRNREAYHRFFNCNVAFGAEFDAIIYPAIDMDRPMTAANTSMARYAESYIETIAARSSTLEGKVRELIAALLPTGRCSLDRVAQHPGCDGRIVQRQLAEQNKSFSELLDEQRAEMAIRLIEDKAARYLPSLNFWGSRRRAPLRAGSAIALAAASRSGGPIQRIDRCLKKRGAASDRSNRSVSNPFVMPLSSPTHCQQRARCGIAKDARLDRQSPSCREM